jgi:RHS repeat-associated protein
MFTGRESDSETGMYCYRVRHCSPTLGRFMQIDPLGYMQGASSYLYVGNNPLLYVDPFGLCKDKPWWEKLGEGYYYGTGFGQSAAEWYAQQQVQTGNPLWAIPGVIASLWTPATYQQTGWTLATAGLGAGWAANTGPTVTQAGTWVLQQALPWIVAINYMVNPIASTYNPSIPKMPPGTGQAIQQIVQGTKPIIDLLNTIANTQWKPPP